MKRVRSTILSSRFTVSCKAKHLIILKVAQLEKNYSAQYYCATGHLVSNTHKGCTTAPQGTLYQTRTKAVLKAERAGLCEMKGVGVALSEMSV